jgi:carbonic anhydrase
METNKQYHFKDYFLQDFLAGFAVFLVAIPLCLGIALASGAPLLSGVMSGIIGGIVIGFLSKSHTSVSGPTAGIVAVFITSIQTLGSYEACLVAVLIAGLLQIATGFARFGIVANYIPSSVIRGLLGAIGIIIILKQIPYLFGYVADNEGDFSFFQANGENTISALFHVFSKINISVALVGLVSIASIILWNKYVYRVSKKLARIPSSLVAILIGIPFAYLLEGVMGAKIDSSMFVNLPIIRSYQDFTQAITTPSFTFLADYRVYIIALSLFAILSTETLLSIESSDKLDTKKRYTDPSRELVAQGIGNVLCGFVGALPIASVVIRSSVNVTSGSKSKVASIIHGLLLLVCVALMPALLNKIPLASLAAILILTGYKLIKIPVLREMYSRGANQFIPFICTIFAILFTDLIIGVGIGLICGLYYILKSHYQNPFKLYNEITHIDQTTRIELPQQVSFLNKNAFMIFLYSLPENAKLVIDARSTEYIDYDIIELMREFKAIHAPLKKIKINLVGFKKRYHAFKFHDINQFRDIVTKEIQKNLKPSDVLTILKDGNKRFVSNKRINRDLLLQMHEVVSDQHPMAVILSCIDSRTSVELVFDLGLGDVFSVRIAGNIVNNDILGSIEFACKVAGAKLIVVLGHTNCGAIKGACDGVRMGHLTGVVEKIQKAIDIETQTTLNRNSSNETFTNNVTNININLTKLALVEQSPIIHEMLAAGEVTIVGAMYDISSGVVKFDV